MRTPGLGLSRFSSTSGVLPMASTMSAYLPPHGRSVRRGSTIASESVARGFPPPGHGGQDDDRVPRLDGRVESLEHTHVLVVQIDVDVTVQAALLREQLALRSRVL